MTRRPLPAASTLGRAILLAAFLLALSLPRPASAATITVNTFVQGSVPGFCSLAEAIASANNDADTGGCVGVGAYGADTIELQTGTYNLTAIDNNQNGTPMIIDPLGLTINGNGSTIARTVGGVAPFFRIFEVTGGSLTLNSLTLTGGNPGAGFNGGAVLDSSTGTLTITSCTFSGNTAQDGGGIHKSGSGNVTVTGSTFTNNTATSSVGDADGGAIKIREDFGGAAGNVTITGSTFTNNTATSSGGDADGGALVAERVSVTVTGSRFTNNTATSSGGDADGGALDVDAESASVTVTVTGSTFTNNAATSSGADDTDDAIGGGAIKVSADNITGSGTLSVTTSIFVNNRATRSGADNASRGGALLDESSSGVVNNNCFVGNTAQSGGGVFRGGSPTVNAENNWWGAANGPSEAGPGSGDGVSSNVDFDPFLTSPPFAGCELGPIPTLSEWAQLGMIALLIVGGLLALRRSSGQALRRRRPT